MAFAFFTAVARSRLCLKYHYKTLSSYFDMYANAFAADSLTSGSNSSKQITRLYSAPLSTTC